MTIPLALFSSEDKPESLSGDFKTDVGVFTKAIKKKNHIKYNRNIWANTSLMSIIHAAHSNNKVQSQI